MNFIRLLIILFIPVLFLQSLDAAAETMAPMVNSTPSENPLETDSKILTLEDCYQLALKRSELIAIQSQIIKEAEGRFYQALSGILPDISYVITENREYGHDFANKERGQRFTFSQPLFSGFKEFAAIAASRAEKRERRAEKKRAEELLFVDVADAFYFYLSYRDQEETFIATRAALSDRVTELKRREDVGRSRPSEVASVDAQLSRLDADLQDVLSNKETARQLLEFLIGTSFKDLNDEDQKLSFQNLNYYEDKAPQRADVKAAYESWQVARKQIGIARAGFLPSVTADGNYYTKREGTNDDIDWDMGLTVDVPIFKGMENVGAVKEANSIAEQEKLLYERAKRQAVLDIQNTYTRVEKAILKEEALRKAWEATETNYKLQVEDYQRSLVNNLDVLQALEDLQDSRQRYAVSRRETKRLFWNFKVATGELR